MPQSGAQKTKEKKVMGVEENQSEEDFDANAVPEEIDKKQMLRKNSWKLNM